MARTLADLTLKLSRDLSALEAQCTKRLDAIDEARDQALMTIDFARKILIGYNKGLSDAKAAQLKSIQEANSIRDNEIRSAEDKRRRAAVKEEGKYRQTKYRVYQTMQAALKKAKVKWDDDIKKIRNRPLSEQRTLRKEADQRYEDAIATARETYHDALEDARVAHQSALQDVLTEERLAFERANQTVERMISSAVVAYERAVADEEARLRNELAKDPEARRTQETHDRQHATSRRDCEKKKEALFRKFSADRKKLSA